MRERGGKNPPPKIPSRYERRTMSLSPNATAISPPRWTLTGWDTFSISSLPLLFVILSTSECLSYVFIKYKKGYEE